MTTLTELKKLAEAATDWDTSTYHAFYEKANPAKLIEILDTMEQMRKALVDCQNIAIERNFATDSADEALAAYERLNKE